jgi:DMSO reductase family type II enzyme heme b subunit
MRFAQVPTRPVDPDDPAWELVARLRAVLSPIPLDAQPNAYIRTAWAARPYGRVNEVELACAEHGGELFVRLAWQRPDEAPAPAPAPIGGPSGEFPDGAGVYFLRHGSDAPAATIGRPDAPVVLWRWRERLEGETAAPAAWLAARGPGVFRPEPDAPPLDVAARLSGGRWSVVLAGPLAPLGELAGLGAVVWDGANDERAGIGAASPEWLGLPG